MMCLQLSNSVQFHFAICNQMGIMCSIAWIGVLFVGCDDEASEDVPSHGLSRH